MEYINFETFNHEMGLNFGLSVLEIIKEKKLKPVRIRVVLEDDIIFQYMMDGKSGDLWLNRKQHTVYTTHQSSLYVFNHQQDYKDIIENEDYAICGGGYPVYVNHEFKGALIVSGLAHQEDHQLILEAIERMKK